MLGFQVVAFSAACAVLGTYQILFRQIQENGLQDTPIASPC
jgi:hypothetical protein